MRSSCYLLLLILLIAGLSACTTTGPVPFTRSDNLPALTWPSAPEPTRIEFISEFTGADDLGLDKSFFSKLKDWLFGEEDRRMSRPYAVAVDAEKVIVADPQSAVVHVFDMNRQTYRKIHRAGKMNFIAPVGVALGGDRLFIADSMLNKVFVLDKNFEPLMVIDDFLRPTGLAFDSLHQQLYVTDTLAHQVRVFDHNGQFMFSIGERGEFDAQFNYPSHLAFSGGRLFVNDTMNFRIQIFQHDGHYLNSFGKHGDASGAFGQSKGVAVDADGHVYVADALAGRVQIFDQNGVFLLGFGSSGKSPGNFLLPAGLAFWQDKIFVADSYNRRIQVFRYLGEES